VSICQFANLRIVYKKSLSKTTKRKG
jgi:hypothetical protein